MILKYDFKIYKKTHVGWRNDEAATT